jgi:hypothetical protein
MTAGAKIAVRIAAGLARAGDRTGTGPLICTIAQKSGAQDVPWEDDFTSTTYSPLTAIDFPVTHRDRNGLVLAVVRTLTVNATGAVPAKGERIAVGMTPEAVQTAVDAGTLPDTAWSRIMEVKPLAPAGVALLYELELEK